MYTIELLAYTFCFVELIEWSPPRKKHLLLDGDSLSSSNERCPISRTYVLYIGCKHVKVRRNDFQR